MDDPLTKTFLKPISNLLLTVLQV